MEGIYRSRYLMKSTIYQFRNHQSPNLLFTRAKYPSRFDSGSDPVVLILTEILAFCIFEDAFIEAFGPGIVAVELPRAGEVVLVFFNFEGLDAFTEAFEVVVVVVEGSRAGELFLAFSNFEDVFTESFDVVYIAAEVSRAGETYGLRDVAAVPGV